MLYHVYEINASLCIPGNTRPDSLPLSQGHRSSQQFPPDHDIKICWHIMVPRAATVCLAYLRVSVSSHAENQLYRFVSPKPGIHLLRWLCSRLPCSCQRHYRHMDGFLSDSSRWNSLVFPTSSPILQGYSGGCWCHKL